MELERQKQLLNCIQKWHPDDAPADLPALQQWLADPEKATVIRDLDALWELTQGAEPPEIEVDEAAAYRAVQQKAGLTSAYTRPVLIGILLKAAAAMVLLVGVAYLVGSAVGRIQTIEYVAADAVRRVDLPDGSTVWLRPSARLSAPDKFAANRRSVYLEGSAYFEVVGNPGQPFRVNGPSGAQVDVLGTAFGVESGVNLQVVVREGTVRLQPPGGEAGPVLRAGDMGRYEGVNRRVAVSRRGSSNALSWHTGGLEFVGTPLQTVIQDIETHYNTRIIVHNTALLGCPYTAPFTRQPVDEVVEALAYALKMRLTRQPDGTFVLDGGKCQ
jgi:ferric-dicitrate binding protein FerR (iron transport regulator)